MKDGTPAERPPIRDRTKSAAWLVSPPHFDLTEELRVRVAFVKAELVAHVRLDPFHAVRAGAPAGEELFRFAVLADVDVARDLFARVPGDRGFAGGGSRWDGVGACG